MVSLTVAATGKSPLLKGLPISLNITKPVEVATVADVKAALAAKLPRVRSRCVDTRVFFPPSFIGRVFAALRRTAEALAQGRSQGPR
jgi:hypothetical protein